LLRFLIGSRERTKKRIPGNIESQQRFKKSVSLGLVFWLTREAYPDLNRYKRSVLIPRYYITAEKKRCEMGLPLRLVSWGASKWFTPYRGKTQPRWRSLKIFIHRNREKRSISNTPRSRLSLGILIAKEKEWPGFLCLGKGWLVQPPS